MTPPTLSVTLKDWEGPLDLLLHVIRTHKLDILDIPIAFVTEQYLAYLDTMRTLNLDIAAEYLEMAATLAYIKSRTMLPAHTVDDEDLGDLGEEADPREELIRRLLTYQRYKDAAGQLAQKPLLGRDTFVTGGEVEIPSDNGEQPLVELALFDLVEAFRHILERTQLRLPHEVSVDRITVSERIGEISDLLSEGVMCPFDELFQEQPTRIDVVVTLLALLEMTKLRLIRIFQASCSGPIYVTLGGPQLGSVEPAVGTPSAEAPRPGLAQRNRWQRRKIGLRKRRSVPRTIERLRIARRRRTQTRAGRSTSPRRARTAINHRRLTR